MDAIKAGDVLVLGSGVATIVSEPKRVWRKVRSTARPAWLQATTDHTSEAGSVLTFRSVL